MKLRYEDFTLRWVFLILVLLSVVNAGYLHGIGYREQELQQAKGVNFQSDDPTGISICSFAGGTHIFIKGVGLSSNA